MLHLHNNFTRLRIGKFASSRYGGLAVAAFFALAGFITINGISAATFNAGSEAEDGNLAGNHAVTDDPSASNGKAVKFGTGSGPAEPSDLKAYTGGDSIALRWTPGALSPGSTVKQYNIFRDNVQVATVQPGFHADFVELDGAGWIDYNVTKGATYSYKVQTVSSTNATSAMSTPLSVKHPTASAPTPTFTYELNGATDLDDYMKNMVIPFLKVWYPKIANYMAYPDYTPVNSVQLVLKAGHPNILDSRLDTGLITAQTEFIRSNMTSYDKTLAAWLHEIVHTIQGQASSAGNNSPGWMIEGLADYAREYVMHDRAPRFPNINEHYTGGYSPPAYMIDYISSKYDANFVRKTMVAGHNNAFTANTLIMPDGKNIDEVWSAMLGDPSRTGPVKSVAYPSKCMDVASRNFADTTKLQIYGCNGDAAQKITAWSDGKGTAKLLALGKCLDVNNSGTANGTNVWLYNCSGSAAQQWVLNNDGTIVNPNSNKCLEIANGNAGGTDGAQLQIWDCQGTNWQKWTISPNSPKFGQISFKSSSGQCLDDPSGITADGTRLQVYACNGQAPQKWTVTGPKDNRTALSVMGKCATASDMAQGSPVQLYGCSGNTSQVWKAQSNGSFKNQKSGLCLDTVGSSTANGALLSVNNCNGSASQSFNF